MTFLRKLLATNAPAAVILVRLIVGAVFLSEGIQKFLYPDALGGCRDQRHDPQDQGLFRLPLTVLLPSGVSASRGHPGEGCRGRVGAVRASARTAPDASARRRLPPAGVVAVRLPHRPQDGRADHLAAGVTPTP